MPENSTKERIAWVDACKGIGILLVIAGHNMHCVPLYALIYSFHMPLFFLLSAYTMRLSEQGSDFWIRVKKSFLQLVVPAVMVFISAETLTRLLNGKPILTIDYGKQLFRSLLFCNGMVGTFHEVIVEPIGVCWFLVVLFCARTLFDGIGLLVKKRKPVLYLICFVLGILGVFMKRWAFSFTASVGSVVDGRLIPQAEAWPFAFDVTLAVMPFFALGHFLKQKPVIFTNEKKAYTIVTSVILWLAGFVVIWMAEARDGNYFDLICRRYPLFPLCYLTAAAGSMALMGICATGFFKPVNQFLAKLGKHTLLLLFIHKLDFLWEFLWQWTSLDAAAIPIRILVDLLLLSVCLFLKSKLKMLFHKTK